METKAGITNLPQIIDSAASSNEDCYRTTRGTVSDIELEQIVDIWSIKTRRNFFYGTDYFFKFHD